MSPCSEPFRTHLRQLPQRDIRSRDHCLDPKDIRRFIAVVGVDRNLPSVCFGRCRNHFHIECVRLTGFKSRHQRIAAESKSHPGAETWLAEVER